MSSDPWAVREVAARIGEVTNDLNPAPRPRLSGYTAVMADSLDTALDVVGRSGRDILYGLLEGRYGLRREDIVSKPGTYISALREILGGSCDIIERYTLAQVRDRTGVDAHTIEEAVYLLKAFCGES